MMSLPSFDFAQDKLLRGSSISVLFWTPASAGVTVSMRLRPHFGWKSELPGSLQDPVSAQKQQTKIIFQISLFLRG
jgi:hypothetical protein